MRRLDELLTHATERGHRMGPDLLIEHLEHRLTGEREVVVAAPSRRNVMVTTAERTTRTETPQSPRRRWVIALAAFGLAVAAVSIAVVTLGNGGGDNVTEADPIELVEGFATNLRNADIDAMIAGGPVGGVFDRPFVEWHIGLQTNPHFTDCRVTQQSINGSIIVCNVDYNPDSFFVRALDPATNTVSARVADGLVSLMGWPPPAGLSGASADLRLFFEAEHPELVDTVFGSGGYAGLAFSREAGETIAQYLDEYLAYREANS